MNAEDFYEEQFKPALRYLGPGWQKKHKIQMKIRENKLYFIYGGAEIGVDVNNIEYAPEPAPYVAPKIEPDLKPELSWGQTLKLKMKTMFQEGEEK